MAYNLEKDIYACDLCGFESPWDSSDDPPHGSLWGCEICQQTFCDKCFIERAGISAFNAMMGDEESPICCPDCWGKKHPKVTLKGETVK